MYDILFSSLSDVLICLKLFVPILATLELLTICILPYSALLVLPSEPAINGGLNNELVSNDEKGNCL